MAMVYDQGQDPWDNGQPAQPAPPQPDQSLPTPTAAGAYPASNAQTDYSKLFQPGYLGAPTTVAPTNTNAAQTDLSKLLAGWQNPQGPQAAGAIDPTQFGSNQTIMQLLQGFAPQAQRSTNNLNQTLADFGVSGGQAVGANTQLQAQLAAALGPSIASAIQNSQGNTLSALGQNQGAEVSQNNLAAQLRGTNAGQYNAAFASGLGQNTANEQQTNLANQSAANTANGYNADIFNRTNAANVSQQNQSQQQAITNMLNQYYAQMGAFNQINSGGQGAANNQAIQYGSQVTQQADPFTTIFGAAKAAAPYFVGA